MEAPPKVHRHRHRRSGSRRRNESNSAERSPVAAVASRARDIAPEEQQQQQQNVLPEREPCFEQPSLLVNGHEPQELEEPLEDVEKECCGADFQEQQAEQSESKGPDSKNPLQKGIMQLMDRELKVTGLSADVPGKKMQSLSDPQASPAQRSTRSRSSLDKSPRKKRSKSESRRRRERKLIAAGEMEVRQANETLMRYLKQCSEVNDASLSGDLEIDYNFDERRVHRKTKSQRDKRGQQINKNTGKIYSKGGLKSILKDLSEDIIPVNGEIYNPFTPVVSPTEGPPTRIDRMFIQTSAGYRSVDNCYYKNPIGADEPDSNRSSIQTSVNLSCALQRMWIMVSNICHGLLGGLAFAHLLFITTSQPYDWSTGAIKHYSSFAEIYANTFYCLCIICMVSILDRMDICHVNIVNAPETISFRWIIIAMIYIATIILTLCAETMDEKLYLTSYNITVFEEEMVLENQQVISVWSSLSIARSVGAIAGWIMIGLSPTDDLLYNHLLEMEKYQLTSS